MRDTIHLDSVLASTPESPMDAAAQSAAGLDLALRDLTAEGDRWLVARTRSHVSAERFSALQMTAHRAAEIGAGPEVVEVDAERGVLVLRIGAGFQRATLGRIKHYGAVPAIVAARAALQATDLDIPPLDLLVETRELESRARATSLPLSPGLEVLLSLLTRIEDCCRTRRAIARPSMGTADVSSLLVEPGGGALLLPSVFSARIDPLADLGMLAAELYPVVGAEVRELDGGGLVASSRDEAVARLLALVDDMRAALWYSLAASGAEAGLAATARGFAAYREARGLYAATASGQFEAWLAHGAEEGDA